MPPAGRKRGTKVRDSSADMSSGAMGPPPPGKSLVRHSNSELSGSDVEIGKRFKPGSPLVKRAEERTGMETDEVGEKRESRSRKKKPKSPATAAPEASAVQQMGAISEELVSVVLGSKMAEASAVAGQEI